MKFWIIIDILIAILIMIFIAAVFLILESHSNISCSDTLKQLLSVIGTFLSTGSGAIYLILKYPIDFSHFGFDKKNIRKTVTWGSFSGLVISFIQFPLNIVTGKAEIPPELFLDIQSGIYNVLVFLFFMVFLIPLVAELFYRGCLFRILGNRFGMLSAYITSTALFTYAHDLDTSGEILLFIISSLILAYIYEKTKLLGASILAHIIWNFTWYATVYLYCLVHG